MEYDLTGIVDVDDVVRVGQLLNYDDPGPLAGAPSFMSISHSMR